MNTFSYIDSIIKREVPLEVVRCTAFDGYGVRIWSYDNITFYANVNQEERLVLKAIIRNYKKLSKERLKKC